MLGHRRQNDLPALVVALRALPSVADCAVVPAIGAAGPVLLAYVVPRGAFSGVLFRQQLVAALPAGVAVPDAIIPVDALPLDPTGKIDHGALTALPAIDDSLVTDWEQCIGQVPGVRQMAILVEANTPEPRRFPWTAFRAVSTSSPANRPPAMQISRPVADRRAVSESTALRSPNDAPATLSDLLLRAAQRVPQRACIHWLPNGERVERSYAELLHEARQVLTGLRAQGIKPGDHLILQISRGPAFLATVWACFLGGIVPAAVTVAPGYATSNSTLAKLRSAWLQLERPPVVSEAALAKDIRGLEHVIDMPAIEVLTFEALAAHPPAAGLHAASPNDPALMLFTSGSTGNPKALEQRHRNLLAMSAGTIEMNMFTGDDVSLNWMPLDHVGSMVFLSIVPTDLGCTQIHAANNWILEDPVRWLALIEQHRASISWAPNFAFGLLEQHRQSIPERVRDLSSMRFLVNAGEANIAGTMRRFIELLADLGLPANALRPAFGMSETCSGITWSAGFTLATEDGVPVALGRPIPGAALRIVDEAGAVLNEGEVGQLQVRGPSVFEGYYRNPEANQAAFQDGWFTTGDLGTLQDGELIVTGRQKEDIVIHGVHHACHDIEALIERVDGVTTSFTAAVPVLHPDTGAEELAIFFHAAIAEQQPRAALKRRIRGAVAAQTGASPRYLIAVAPDAIPKTAIGKIQRPLLKQRFEAGDFDALLDVDADDPTGAQADWFLRPVWRARVPEPPHNPAGRPLLVIAGGTGPSAALAASVGERWLGPVRILHAGTDLEAQFSLLSREGFAPAEILHLGMFDLASEVSIGTEFAAPAWFEGHVAALAELIAVAHGWTRVWGSQAGATSVLRVATCGPAGLRGFLTTLGREHPGLHCQHIDLAAADETATQAEQVSREVEAVPPEPAVRWRGTERFVPRLERVDWEDDRADATRAFRHGGHYLITGGLGGIGHLLCRHLLERYGARLVVLGTTPLLEAASGASADDGPATDRAQVWRALQQRVGKGSIDYQSIDVCDRDRLAECIARAEASSGPLDGVVHCAGVAAERPLTEETPSSLAATLRAKILGALTLDALLGQRPDMLVLHFSSVSGRFGGAGVGAYAAACGFVEDFAEQQRSACFVWSRWQDIGMSRGRSIDPAAVASGFRSLSAEYGLLSLEVALRRGEDALIIGLDESSAAVRGWLDKPPAALLRVSAWLDGAADVVTDADIRALGLRDRLGRPVDYRIVRLPALPMLASGEIDRGRLAEQDDASAERVAPRTVTEQTVSEIWGELLGTAEFGVFDNFFELGGQSLLATSLVSRLRDRLGVELGIDVVFSAPTIAALAAACDASSGLADSPPLLAVPRDQSVPLSFAQERLWILERMADDGAPYNEMVAMSFHGEVSAAELSRSFAALIDRHEILRTRFTPHGSSAAQEVVAEIELPLRRVDLTGMDGDAQRQALDAAMTDLRRERFDLMRGPLLRAALIQIAPRSFVLSLALHHIIADARSLELLMRDWSALYRGIALPPLSLHYADFTVWQRKWLSGAALEQQLAYWRETLRGAPPVLALPTDFPRPALPLHRGGRVPVCLDAALVGGLRDLGARDGATLFMTLTAIFAVLLGRHSGQTDILLGLPVANRRRTELEGVMGLFVNTLVLRVDLSGSPTFRDLVSRVRQAALGAYAHQDLPFEKLVDDLQPDRNVGTNPLVQVMIELQERPLALLELPDVDVQAADFAEPNVRVDLELHLFEHAGGVQGYFLYDTGLFLGERVVRLAGQFGVLVGSVVGGAGCRVDGLEVLPGWERRRVVEGFAGPGLSVAVSGACLHELVAVQAARDPAGEAVREGGAEVGVGISYGELMARSDRLAARLRRYGIGPEVVVAQYLPRSIAQVVGLLAILKAGGVYLPLEVSDPLERTARLLDDSGAPVVLTSAALEGSLPSHGGQVLLVDDAPGDDAAEAEPVDDGVTPAVNPDGAAYLIYTSGSTGAPKGALLTHRGFVSMIGAQIRAFAITPADRVLQFASVGFDASLSEIFMALGAGACLVVAPEAARSDPSALREVLRAERVSVATLPPPLLRQLGAAGPGGLRLLVTAGEAAPVAEVTAAARGMTVWNAYGPTEASVCATMQLVSAEADYRLGVPIGRPVDGVEVLILRGDMPVPIGVDGEICLGGAVLARGYVGQPGLTAQHFVPHPWRPGERLYRTGDLGRWRSDGAVDYVGRLNHEVKVRGHRVSPGEVERVMLEHPLVGQACVSGYREAGGEGGLCGYYAAGGGLELWPSLAEFFVYDPLLYGAMAGHRERNERYRAAFAKVLAGRTVVEIGPGPEAILARLCVEAGARRVYCIELLRETYEQAVRTVRALGLADRIVVLHGDVRGVSLPEPADYCVSEIVGSLGGSEGAALLINAARRLLRPGGGMIPSRAVTRLAAVSLADGLELAFPETAAHYVEEVFAQKGYRFDLRLCLKHAARRHLLSSEDVLEDLDFTREVAAEADHAVELRFTRDGAWHGFLAWLELHTDASEVLDTLDSQESWLPVYLPLSLAGLPVSAGDVFRGRVERRLSGNGLNPDYRVEGVLERRSGPAETIALVSRHDAPVYRGSEFYRALFAGEAVPVSRPPEPAALRAYLAQRLPRYMVPGRLVRLARLPLTTSGKVDRAALPAAAPETLTETVAAEPPRDAVEAAVAAIWREVLEGAPVGLRDNFFDAGGHSLRLVQVHQRLEARFGPCLTPVELFQFPTIEATANLIKQRTNQNPNQNPNTTQTGDGQAPVLTAQSDVREAGVREALRLQAGLRRAHRAPVETGSGVG